MLIEFQRFVENVLSQKGTMVQSDNMIWQSGMYVKWIISSKEGNTYWKFGDLNSIRWQCINNNTNTGLWECRRHKKFPNKKQHKSILYEIIVRYTEGDGLVNCQLKSNWALKIIEIQPKLSAIVIHTSGYG